MAQVLLYTISTILVAGLMAGFAISLKRRQKTWSKSRDIRAAEKIGYFLGACLAYLGPAALITLVVVLVTTSGN